MNPSDPADLISHNSDYLSALISFPDPCTSPLYLTFNSQLEINSSRDPLDCSYLNQTLYWFLRMDNKRVAIYLNGNTDILLQHHWDSVDIEVIRKSPLAVYMYEPLFLKAQDGSSPYVPDNSKPVSEELIWLQDFIDKYQLQNEITVYLCDYNLKLNDLHESERFTFRIETFDTFLLWVSCNLMIDNTKCHQVRIGRREIYPFPRLEKKAICLNFRWEASRELVMIHLRSRPDFNELHCSFFHYHDKNHLLKRLGFDPFLWSEGPLYLKSIEKMKSELPYLQEIQKPAKALWPTDYPIPDFDGIHNRPEKFYDYDLYTQSFLAIVTESRCLTHYPCISEKTLKPMFMKRPFVLIAGPHALRYLKELGFKTFSDFWDESYDQIENSEQRLKAALKLIDSILDKPLSELKIMLRQMEAILHHNHVHAGLGLSHYYKNKLEASLNKNALPQG